MAMGASEMENPASRKSPREEAAAQHRLVCRAGGQLCAVPLGHVVEVMRIMPISRVSGAPHYVCGLSIIRGEPVPVVDTGLLVGGRATASQRLITVRAGGRTIALAAEAVLGTWAIGTDQLRQLPPLLRDAATETIAAVGTLDAELVFLLQAARIIPPDLFDRLLAAEARS